MAIINAALSNRWTRTETPVPSLSTVSLDTIPLSQYRATKYLIEIANTSLGHFKAMEMYGFRDGISVSDSVYGRIGGPINIALNLSVAGSDVVLSATNNESYDVNVTLTKTI